MAGIPLGLIFEHSTETLERLGRPQVILSYAQSLDGCIAARRGCRLALSGADSMKLTHTLRAGNDAVLVGIGTVLADDPLLSVRLAKGPSPRPVVLDSRLRLPVRCHLLHNGNRPWVLTTPAASASRQASLEAIARVGTSPPEPARWSSQPLRRANGRSLTFEEWRRLSAKARPRRQPGPAQASSTFAFDPRKRGATFFRRV